MPFEDADGFGVVGAVVAVGGLHRLDGGEEDAADALLGAALFVALVQLCQQPAVQLHDLGQVADQLRELAPRQQPVSRCNSVTKRLGSCATPKGQRRDVHEAHDRAHRTLLDGVFNEQSHFFRHSSTSSWTIEGRNVSEAKISWIPFK